ncbi:alkaline phosphatase [Flavivirga sp. 57AJ16]|uniref:alkaline phosphatase n=1 Tax=Flavivirga sp. 57AJ16 TaxID=3025307 RepID=UPI00236647EC|nr:alkaline phosphatase [Flavivirga sp. 57AJ16]MDD7886954.1 alkaline phosphatase [Flavivirga sp. 57AJ16]
MLGKKTSILLLLLLVLGCSGKKDETTSRENVAEPLNLILMIGDGMGISQVTSAFYFGEKTPNFKQFEYVGLSLTSSTSHLITDSASGATALSTGEKTYRRAIGVSKDTLPLPTILEQLQAKGYQTGLVSLTSLTHATPASFYAHVKDRDMHEEIAEYMVNANIDFLAGGGIKYLSERKDGHNLFDSLLKFNYNVDTLSLSKPVMNKQNAFILANDALPNKLEGRKDFLPEATKAGLEYFEGREKPFFFMVEGSYIDWGGHAMSDEMMIQEVLDFDKTIGVVLEFLKKHPNTLVVVTADHETGGASIGKYYEIDENGNKIEIPKKVKVNFNSDQHTAALVPVFAKGVGEELFKGIYENNEIYHKMLEVLGTKNASETISKN